MNFCTNPTRERGIVRPSLTRRVGAALIRTARRRRLMELTVVKNATCTFCGCVCDDIELHSDGVRITHTKAACVLGVSWFKNHTAEHLYPDALIDGKEATVDEAIEA